MENFYTKISNWLKPLGYVEIFTNHPCATIREWHFCKEGIRVICVNDTSDYKEGYCYLYADILKPDFCTIAIKTMKFPIKTGDLENLHNYMLDSAKTLQSKEIK